MGKNGNTHSFALWLMKCKNDEYFRLDSWLRIASFLFFTLRFRDRQCRQSLGGSVSSYAPCGWHFYSLLPFSSDVLTTGWSWASLVPTSRPRFGSALSHAPLTLIGSGVGMWSTPKPMSSGHFLGLSDWSGSRHISCCASDQCDACSFHVYGWGKRCSDILWDMYLKA